MKKIYYFEINEEVIFCNSKKEILEAYLLKVPVEAIGDVPIISARVVERDFPANCAAPIVFYWETFT